VEADGVAGDQGQHDAHAQGGDAMEEDDQASRFDEVRCAVCDLPSPVRVTLLSSLDLAAH